MFDLLKITVLSPWTLPPCDKIRGKGLAYRKRRLGHKRFKRSKTNSFSLNMDRFTVIYGIIVIGLIEFKESYANSDGKFMKIKVKSRPRIQFKPLFQFIVGI